jgi:excisionase family DNA binding protein
VTGGKGAVGKAAPARLALSRDEAAEALGVSRDHFDRHVLPHVKTAAVGRRVLVPVRELEDFLAGRAV